MTILPEKIPFKCDTSNNHCCTMLVRCKKNQVEITLLLHKVLSIKQEINMPIKIRCKFLVRHTFPVQIEINGGAESFEVKTRCVFVLNRLISMEKSRLHMP